MKYLHIICACTLVFSIIYKSAKDQTESTNRTLYVFLTKGMLCYKLANEQDSLTERDFQTYLYFS